MIFWISSEDRQRFLQGEQIPEKCLLDPARGGSKLGEANPEVVITSWQTPCLPGDWLSSRGCRLRYVCHLGGGVRRQVPRQFLEQGGLVTNWGDIAAPAVAEHALLLALAALRDAGRWRDAIATGQRPATRSLFGRRVGLHGFGRVAQQLVRLLQPFRVTIQAYSAGVPDEVFPNNGVTAAGSLEALLAHSEVLFECEALTPATIGSVTAAGLMRLPPEAVFVNVGRGAVVDEAALGRAAVAGRLRVAVDVVAHEPVTADSALLQAPGVIVSPHLGGPVTEDYAAVGRDALANLRRYESGQPLENVVDLASYDRST